MSKICGYSCEHNKSGVCQISVCDKRTIMSDKTEAQIFTRYIDPTITKLQQENLLLKENAEHNDKVVDKVNWENMLLKKENKQLKDNWNKLRKYFNERIEVCDNRLSTPFCNFEKATKERLIFSQCLEKLEELEQGSDNK